MKQFFLIISLAAMFTAKAADSLQAELAPLKPFLGKTWRGVFKESKPENPTIDISRWERALNGKAIRVLHSVNEGAYGGESIIRWDAEKKQVTYYYFTTAGFMTTGTMTFADGKITTYETVSGNASGITAVRATYTFSPNGGYALKSEYEKNGEWTPGREASYTEDATAQVRFR